MKKADVLAYFNGGTKAAKALRMTKSAVSLWGEKIPEGRAYQVQVITNGKLKVNPADYRGKA